MSSDMNARFGPGTPLGLAALVLWSTTFAVSRHLTESLGVLTAAACVYIAGGVVACAAAALHARFGAMFRLPPRYLLYCGSLFVAYTVCIYIAVGKSPDRVHASVVVVINYLWPALTLVLAVPLAKRRARWTLWPGVALALIGTFLAVTSAREAGISEIVRTLRDGAVPYACAAAAAVAWGLYSNLSRMYGAKDVGAVPLFLLAALAYTFWDRGVRTGNFVLLASASYLAPILGTLWMVVYLRVPARPPLWIGCGLVTAGAFICRFSFLEHRQPE
jgi:drug/metabolite transporter (DMT)-like permease